MEQLAMIPRSRQLFEATVFSIMERSEAAERAKTNFKYISFDWVDPCGWFFWPRDRQGVYKVQEQPVQPRRRGATAAFSLYYYPHPDEEVFAAFSIAEQLARVSELFSRQGVGFFAACSGHGHCGCPEEPFRDLQGGKGIPTPVAREHLSDSLYWIGTLTLTWRHGHLRAIAVEAPFRSQTRAITAIPSPQGGEPLLRAGDLDRDVPCWRLTHLFLADLVGDLAQPVRLVRQAGASDADSPLRYSVLFNNAGPERRLDPCL